MASKSQDRERPKNASGGTAGMHAVGKSDGSIVPAKPANKGAAEAPAESVEERDPAKRNADQDNSRRTPGRNERSDPAAGKTGCRVPGGLERVREAARRPTGVGARGSLRFTALLHHIDEVLLRYSFYQLKRDAAVGIDEVTWQEYEGNLGENIRDLKDRVHQGAYRAQPSLRVWIPKPDGGAPIPMGRRPLGIASLEDKIVQKAAVLVLQNIYEEDFLGFSYGFRPERSQHQALDALCVAVTGQKVNWVLDADIAGFFDGIDHAWLIKFLEHRIGDRRVLRLIRKWLRAGVSEEGQWSETKVGTPQGAVIAPPTILQT